MEPNVEPVQPQFRSGGMGFGLDDIHGLISAPPETDGNSFTALLELPPPQAVELLVNEDFPAKPLPPPIFPSDSALIDRASMFSVFASADKPPTTSPMRIDSVKQEPSETEHHRNSSSPAVSNQSLKSGKRKEREKTVKQANKKSKKTAANETCDENGKLPYVHIRAGRGKATDSHSLAERARREKINARMKLLQDLVPGCNKISGTALVLDEIINHVQALQRQVEFLSMRLAAVNPRIDFNVDALLAAENDNSYLGMFAPSTLLDGQTNGSRQHQYQQQQQQLQYLYNGLHQLSIGRVEDNSNFITPETSLLSYDSPANSASLHSSQLKMEL